MRRKHPTGSSKLSNSSKKIGFNLNKEQKYKYAPEIDRMLGVSKALRTPAGTLQSHTLIQVTPRFTDTLKGTLVYPSSKRERPMERKHPRKKPDHHLSSPPQEEAKPFAASELTEVHASFEYAMSCYKASAQKNKRLGKLLAQ